jgi:hypothetical protein
MDHGTRAASRIPREILLLVVTIIFIFIALFFGHYLYYVALP